MLITCPACEAKYLVDGAAVGSGRDVKCAKCAHSWFFTPPEETPEILLDPEEFEPPAPAEPEPIPEESSLPAVVEKTGPGVGLWVGLAASVLFMLATATLTFRDSLPFLSGLYKTMGYYDVSGLELANVTFESRQIKKRQRIKITCDIINTAEKGRKAPALMAMIVDADGSALDTDPNILDDMTAIGAGKQVDCGNQILQNRHQKATHLLLMLGNPFELSLAN